MAEKPAHIGELELEVVRLMKEVDRYRQAAADTLEQVDWCIGYFTAKKQPAIAKWLSANRSQIRTKLLNRAAQSLPEPGPSSADRPGP